MKLGWVVCDVCDELFKKLRTEQIYCSRECGNKARSARAVQYHQMKIEKRCYLCVEVKSIECFSKNRATLDGYKPICKLCAKIEQKQRLHRVKFSNERQAIYAATAKRGQLRARAKRYSARSNASVEEWLYHMSNVNRVGRLRKYLSDDQMKEAQNMRNRIRYQNDLQYRGKVKSYQRERHRQFPWIMLTRKHRRDARLAGVFDDGSVSTETMKALWINTKMCLYCGRELTDFNKSVEHMHPMSNGGSHTIGNVIIVCAACNERKRQKYFDEWVEVIDEPFRSMSHERFIVQFSGSCPVIG